MGIPGHPDPSPAVIASPIKTRAESPGLDAIVRAAQAGDVTAFGALFDTYHAVVYRYAASRLGTTVDAEDVAAETFAAAFAAIRRFHWQGPPFEAWLFRIARSKVVDHQRRVVRQPTSTLKDQDQAAHSPDGDPADQVLWHEQRADLLSAVRRLSPDQQEVLALRFFAGLSVLEVGGVMGRSNSAVKQLQFRAVTTLRRYLEPLR